MLVFAKTENRKEYVFIGNLVVKPQELINNLTLDVSETFDLFWEDTQRKLKINKTIVLKIIL